MMLFCEGTMNTIFHLNSLTVLFSNRAVHLTQDECGGGETCKPTVVGIRDDVYETTATTQRMRVESQEIRNFLLRR